MPQNFVSYSQLHISKFSSIAIIALQTKYPKPKILNQRCLTSAIARLALQAKDPEPKIPNQRLQTLAIARLAFQPNDTERSEVRLNGEK